MESIGRGTWWWIVAAFLTVGYTGAADAAPEWYLKAWTGNCAPSNPVTVTTGALASGDVAAGYVSASTLALAQSVEPLVTISNSSGNNTNGRDGAVSSIWLNIWRNNAQTVCVYMFAFDGVPAPECNTDPVIIVQAAGWDTNPNPAVGSALAYERGPADVALGGCGFTWQSARLDSTGFGICGTDSTPGATGMFVTRCAYNYVGTGLSASGGSGGFVDGGTAGWTPEPPACQGVLTTVGGAITCIPVAGTPYPVTDVAPLVVDGVAEPRLTVEEIYLPGSLDGGRSSGFPGSGSATWTIGGHGRGNEGATTVISGGGSGSGTATIIGAVQIDEMGTSSDGSGAFVGGTATVAGGQGELLDAISGGTAPTLPWEWTFSFPSLSCVPWDFTFKDHTSVVDWCGAFGLVRSILGWALGILTALYIWRLFANSQWR